jgi:hypothetical protein
MAAVLGFRPCTQHTGTRLQLSTQHQYFDVHWLGFRLDAFPVSTHQQMLSVVAYSGSPAEVGIAFNMKTKLNAANTCKMMAQNIHITWVQLTQQTGM